MGASSSCMDNTFWDTFMVESVDFLSSNLVFKKRRPGTVIDDFEPTEV